MKKGEDLKISFGLRFIKTLTVGSSLFLIIYTAGLIGYNIVTQETLSKIFLVIIFLWLVLLAAKALLSGENDKPKEKEKIFTD